MTTDFRALCAELLDAYIYCVDRYMSGKSCDDSLVQRARTALAEPEPKGPTDEELDNVMFQAVWECMDADDLTNDEWDRLKARAVLARWGRGRWRHD